MKKSVLLIVIVLVVVFTGKNVLATGTNAEFKAYSITEVDDLFLGKDIKAVWKISYSETETPITVVKQKTSKGTEYVVHSKYFEVCYLVSNKGFGTKELRKCCRNIPTPINSAVINQEQMKKQRVITPNRVDDEKAIGLIASYLPELINNGYTHVLN